MEIVAALLIFGAVFYLLMRWGCGARMVHGLALSGRVGTVGTSAGHVGVEALDPVCGMTVKEADSISEEHGGRVFRFCSEDCHSRFKAHPEIYTNS